MRQFKRSSNGIATVICYVGFWILLSILILTPSIDPLVICSILILYCIVFILLTCIFLLPDFDYYIRFNDHLIIFEMSEDDHRAITRSFSIASQTRKKIVLDDGIFRTKISYNKEVLEFLNKIKI